MFFEGNILKDTVDYIWGWGSFAGAIIVPILIWYFGSSRAQAKRTKEEQVENLNYLIMMTYRYFQYLQTLDAVVQESKNKMIIFINNPTEETKFDAFHQLVPPLLRFDVKTSDYAFTINKQSNLINLLFKFLSLMDELYIQINHLNGDASMIYRTYIPMENYIKTAKGYVELNLKNFSATIWLALFVLYKLFETVYSYEKYLKPSGLTRTYIPPEIIIYMKSIINNLNQLYGNETWQKVYDDAIEPVKQSLSEKIYSKFKDMKILN